MPPGAGNLKVLIFLCINLIILLYHLYQTKITHDTHPARGFIFPLLGFFISPII